MHSRQTIKLSRFLNLILCLSLLAQCGPLLAAPDSPTTGDVEATPAGSRKWLPPHALTSTTPPTETFAETPTPIAMPADTPAETGIPTRCGILDSAPSRSSSYFTDPDPVLTRTSNELVLRKELYGFPDYGALDTSSDILYTGQAATWHFTLPPSVDPAAVQRAFFRASVIADDHYTVPLDLYRLAVWTNGSAQACFAPAPLPHGSPYRIQFTNWMQQDYASPLASSRYTVTLANCSAGTDTYDWFAIDWIELHLILNSGD